jgi:MarR family 2-MHQ and catechol resistance regulon transcriptional repressor
MQESSAADTVLLTQSELASWRGFLRVHAALERELDAELIAAHGLQLSSYEVLLTVADAPAERMRMSEIADSVLLSRSGVTRLVDRLERDGLVERTACPSDRRGFFAQLTAAGLERLAAVMPDHNALIARWFTGLLPPDRLARLLTDLRQIRDQVSPGATAGSNCPAELPTEPAEQAG